MQKHKTINTKEKQKNEYENQKSERNDKQWQKKLNMAKKPEKNY